MQAPAIEPLSPSSSPSPAVWRQIRNAIAAHGITPRRVRLLRGRLFALSSGSLQGLHLLLSGHLKLLRFSDDGRVILMDLLDVGEVFGESAVLDPESAEPTSYIQALSDATIDSLSPLVVQRLLCLDPGLSLSIAKLVSRRRVEMERRLLTQVFDRVPVRLAERLLSLAHRYGVPEPTNGNGSGAVRLSVVLSQQDLANWIGASREIVSLTLSDFRRQGAVKKSGRTLILYPKKLQKLDVGLR